MKYAYTNLMHLYKGVDIYACGSSRIQIVEVDYLWIPISQESAKPSFFVCTRMQDILNSQNIKIPSSL